MQRDITKAPIGKFKKILKEDTMNTKEDRKGKERNRNRENKQKKKRKIVDLYPTISINTLNIMELKTIIKRNTKEK